MIIFHNKSSLPIECITTFGVSVKENEHPIGYFGTGLKYALAVLLREGCNIELWIDGVTYQFEKVAQDVRGKEFEFIFMHSYGQDSQLASTTKLPFTTELGKNWKLWQAYRELWSNCMDETGLVYQQEVFTPDHEGTHLCVQGEVFDQVHELRDEFLLLSEPKYILQDLEIHSSEKPAIFYKGIKVAELGTKYSYNILSDMSLTEDRTASQWDVEYAITSALLRTTNKDALFGVVSVTEDNYRETKFDYTKWIKPSTEFMTLVSKLRNRKNNVSVIYDHHYPDFISCVGKASLSRSVIKKLTDLKGLLKFQPKEILITASQKEDFRVVKDAVVLKESLLKTPQRLKLAYLVACFSMQEKNRGKSSYDIIADNLLTNFKFEKEKTNVN